MGPVHPGMGVVLADLHRIPISRSTWRPGARSAGPRCRGNGDATANMEKNTKELGSTGDLWLIYS